MAPEVVLSLASLALFSLADLRYRMAPGVAAYFLAAVLLAAPEDPLRVGLVTLAVGWGWLCWPSALIIPALFSPAAWVVLLVGSGVRRGLVGKADLLALGSIACLFDWPAAALALLGVEVWRRGWKWQQFGGNRLGDTPRVAALPGMLLGFAVYLLWRLPIS